MKWLLFAALALGPAAACGGRATTAAHAPASGSSLAERQPIECLPRQDEKFHAQLEAGYSLRELAVWFTAATCRAVVAPRELLDRSSPAAVDRVVASEELDMLLRSLLAGMKLEAVVGGDLVVVFEPEDVVVFTPRNLSQNPAARPNGSGNY